MIIMDPEFRLADYPLSMTQGVTLTATYRIVDDDWVEARVEELPQVITAAPSLAEAKTMLRDALAEYLGSLRSPANGIPSGAEQEELELTIN